MLLKCCTQYANKFGNLSSGQRTGNAVFIPISKKANNKECSNYHTIALISYDGKLMLKILKTRHWKYVNWEIPDIQAGFRKGRGTRDQIVNICWVTKKARVFQKNVYFHFSDSTKDFDCMKHSKLWKILQERNIRSPDLPPEKSVFRSRNNS